MAEKAHIQTLFAYHWHTTGRLLAGAAALSPEEYVAPSGFGHGSIHDLLLHLLRVAYAWRAALETGRQPAPLAAEAYPDLGALRAGFAQERLAWEALLDGLDDEAIGAAMGLTRPGGAAMTMDRWRVLHQVLLHGMQHHAELAQLLTQKGQSPGNLDFIFYR